MKASGAGMQAKGRPWKVLVTGAGGCVGSAIVDLLCQKNGPSVSEIRGFDILPHENVRGFKTNKDPGSGIKLEYIEGDLRNADEVKRAAEGVDAVIHAGAIINITPTEEEEKEMMNVNIKGTENVLQACKDLSIRHLIFTSSIEVVGGKDQQGILEGDETLPVCNDAARHSFGVYPYTKLVGEKLILAANGTKLSDGSELVTAALRPLPIYGEYERNAVPTVLSMAKQMGGFLCKVGWNIGPFQYTYSGNVAWAHVVTLKTMQTQPCRVAGNVYFITDDSPPHDFYEFSKPFLSAVNCRLLSITIPLTLVMMFMFALKIVCAIVRPFFHLHINFNPQAFMFVYNGIRICGDKLRQDTGYTPRFTHEEAKQRTIDYLVRNPKVLSEFMFICVK